jgi:hypothetical protein
MTELIERDRAANRRAEVEQARCAVEVLRSSEGWKRWLGLRRHFHRYSFANQLLIAVQKAEATRVAGFRTWLNLGYCVKRGEKALRICADSADQGRDGGVGAQRRDRRRATAHPLQAGPGL